jgi:hypothetical protein
MSAKWQFSCILFWTSQRKQEGTCLPNGNSPAFIFGPDREQEGTCLPNGNYPAFYFWTRQGAGGNMSAKWQLSSFLFSDQTGSRREHVCQMATLRILFFTRHGKLERTCLPYGNTLQLFILGLDKGSSREHACQMTILSNFFWGASQREY